MSVQTAGVIDISPPLTWAEVKSSGFVVLPSYTPIAPDGRLASLRCIEEVVSHDEGQLHRFTFDAIVAVMADIPAASRDLFTQQVQEIVSAFPTHTFGGVTRVIRFKGDAIEDVWRVGVAVNGTTVGRQNASITWVNA